MYAIAAACQIRRAVRPAVVIGLAGLLTVASGAAPGRAGEPVAFGDVDPERYYTEPVAWMAAEEITIGVAPGCFGPDHPATRAQVATFLYRMRGEPSPPAPAPFVDIPVGAYYEDAVAWFADLGVTTGTSPTMFTPDRAVSRAEVATFLYRLALVEGRGGTANPDPGSALFGDVVAGSFYDLAVGWLAGEAITKGTSPTTFSPDRLITRGELATMLHRWAGEPAATLITAHCVAGTAAELAAAELRFLTRLDALRASVGASLLVPDESLTAAARGWSEHMGITDEFGHSGSGDAENVARWSPVATPEEAADAMFDAWVASPGHYANLTGAYVIVGVGVYQDELGRWWATIRFA